MSGQSRPGVRETQRSTVVANAPRRKAPSDRATRTMRDLETPIRGQTTKLKPFAWLMAALGVRLIDGRTGRELRLARGIRPETKRCSRGTTNPCRCRAKPAMARASEIAG